MDGEDSGAIRARLAACERLLAEEREARRRVEALSLLLPTVAEALDVRDVFRRMSEVSQAALPHDVMVLAFMHEGQRITTAFAKSTPELPAPPGLPVLPALRDDTQADTLVKDAELVTRPDGTTEMVFHVEFPPESPGGEWEETSVVVDEVRKQVMLARGYRCSVRVRLLRQARGVGALYFASAVPGAYDRSSLDVARRIADHVSLALAHQELAQTAARVAEARGRAERLEERVRLLTQEVEEWSGAGRIVGVSTRWKNALKQAARVAATETTVLLTGESGTGKEVIARFVHKASPRAEGPLVALNCAALPETLLESELFGHEKGAFSGAISSRVGRIEQAAGGVLFLDEVGEMSPGVQAKLLRVLEQREFHRLGSGRALRADVRVLAATNRDLKEAVAKGTFRQDLYYRLHVFEIALPPLRERPDDILPLAEAFLEDCGRRMGLPVAGISQEARDVLLRQDWPGNVRELRNVVERAVILCEGGLVTSEHLPFGPAPVPVAPPAPPPGALQALHVDTVEKGLIESALERAQRNKSLAARLLGLTRAQLYSRMEKYGLKT